MMLLRLLNPQGIAGFAASICLALLLLIQKGDTRHWQKQAGQFEQLYRAEQASLAGTVANYRAAAEQARDADKDNAKRVAAEQQAINERTSNDFEARLAAARSLAQRLRLEAPGSATDPGNGGIPPVPRLPTAPGSPSQAPGQDRLPAGDALTATEQAIQLDELIRWVHRQHSVLPNANNEARPRAVGGQAAVDNNGNAVASPGDD